MDQYRTRLPLDHVIRFKPGYGWGLMDEPLYGGTGAIDAHEYRLIKNGMTVREALDAGVGSGAINYLVKTSKRIYLHAPSPSAG